METNYELQVSRTQAETFIIASNLLDRFREHDFLRQSVTTHLRANRDEITYPRLQKRKDKARFAELMKAWKRETDLMSSLTDIVSCPAYQSIIRMGGRALPLIFAQLEKEGRDPDLWFPALEEITGDDPVPKEAYGDTVKMAEAWLAWKQQKRELFEGYITYVDSPDSPPTITG